jgi:hypothetical protein
MIYYINILKLLDWIEEIFNDGNPIKLYYKTFFEPALLTYRYKIKDKPENTIQKKDNIIMIISMYIDQQIKYDDNDDNDDIKNNIMELSINTEDKLKYIGDITTILVDYKDTYKKYDEISKKIYSELLTGKINNYVKYESK